MKRSFLISALLLVVHFQMISSQDHSDSIINKEYSWMDSLKAKNFRYKWMETLTDLVILPSGQGVNTGLVPTQRSEVDFVEYEGYTIRSIKIVKPGVFGQSIFDTAAVIPNRASRLANEIHINTSDKVIRRHLLFRIGDRIDPQELADNERLLRDLSFIEDARIIVQQADGDEKLADIILIIKDRWSVGGYLEFEDFDKGKAELWDENILGSGNRFQNNIHWDSQFRRVLGYEASFSDRNIYGSFIDGVAKFQNIFETQSYGITFSKKFLTPDTKWAGNATFSHTRTIRTINYSDILRPRLNVDFNYNDFWIGRSFAMNRNSSVDRNRLNLIVASRIFSEKYFDRPQVTAESFHEYHNKTMWLSTLGFSSQSYYRTNLVYDFGRTEDIPIGYLANITAGKEFGEFSNRFYTSAGLSRGDYLHGIGYIFANVSCGGFLLDNMTFEQAAFRTSLNFFSTLFIIKRFKYRQFISVSYTDGIRRFDYEHININNENGIRGFDQPTVSGNKKVVLNLEAVTFTPYYLLGFRFTSYCFFDLARIAPENISLSKEDFYTGFGFGIRIQNERLAFPAFGIRLAFYPNLPWYNLNDMVSFHGDHKVSHPNFYIREPALLGYE